MVLRLFEFLEQNTIDTFLIKITQFEKTIVLGQVPLGYLEIEFHF